MILSTKLVAKSNNSPDESQCRKRLGNLSQLCLKIQIRQPFYRLHQRFNETKRKSPLILHVFTAAVLLFLFFFFVCQNSPLYTMYKYACWPVRLNIFAELNSPVNPLISSFGVSFVSFEIGYAGRKQ